MPFSVKWQGGSGSITDGSACGGCFCYNYSGFAFTSPNASVSMMTDTSNNEAVNSTWHRSVASGVAPFSFIPTGSVPSTPSGSGSTDALELKIVTVGNPNFANYANIDVDAYLPKPPEPAVESAPFTLDNVPGISPVIPSESSAWAGTEAFWGSIGTTIFDTGNYLLQGALDEERYNEQVTAAGEELYNTAKNLGYSDESIVNVYGLAQALAGDAMGTNDLAEAIEGYDLGQNRMLDGWERAEKAASGTAQVAGTLALGLQGLKGLQSPKTNKGTFVDLMSPEEAARYRSYWHDAKLKQYSPGTRQLERMQLSEDGKYVYTAVSHFDEFGRLRAETHYSVHRSTGVLHPNPHYHLYDRIKGKLLIMPGVYLGE